MRYDLLPTLWLAELAAVMTYGATKYGDMNWLKGMAWGKLVGSCYRHLEAWRAGETINEESGRTHLAHAAWNLLALMTYEEFSLGTDNRKEIHGAKLHKG